LRLLLDEHYNFTIAEELRKRDVDAVAVQKERPELEGQDDDVVLRTATVERRVVVTNNVRDCAPLVRALVGFVEGAPDDDLLNGCLYLPRP
jgi:predicted nuclease of predicted toxin-antitoxin system